MIDIDYIVNGKKSKKGKSKKQQSKDPFKDLFGMLQPAKKSKSKSKQNSDPGPLNPTKIMGIGGMGNILGDKKNKKRTSNNPLNNGFLDLFKGKGHPNPTDKKTPQQKEFLNKTKLGSGKSIKRFADWDGDGVINGLDCAPKNRKKHGVRDFKKYLESKGIKFSEELTPAEIRWYTKLYKRVPGAIKGSHGVELDRFNIDDQEEYISEGEPVPGGLYMQDKNKGMKKIKLNFKQAHDQKYDKGTKSQILAHEVGHKIDIEDMPLKKYKSYNEEGKKVPYHGLKPLEKHANIYSYNKVREAGGNYPDAEEQRYPYYWKYKNKWDQEDEKKEIKIKKGMERYLGNERHDDRYFEDDPEPASQANKGDDKDD